MQQVNQRTPRIKLAPQSTSAVIKWRHSPAAQQLRISSAAAELRGPCKSTPCPPKVGGGWRGIVGEGWCEVDERVNGWWVVGGLNKLYACLPIGVSMSMSAGSSESAPLFHAIFKLIRPTSSTFIIENENISIIHSHMPAHAFYSDTCLCIIATFNTFVLGRGIESERRR